MARVKRGTKRRARRKKYLRRTKGFFLTKSKLYQSAQEAANRADRYAKRDRRVKKTRISQALDSAHRRRRPQQRPDLRPANPRPESRRRLARSQNPRGYCGQGCRRLYELGRQRQSCRSAPSQSDKILIR